MNNIEYVNIIKEQCTINEDGCWLYPNKRNYSRSLAPYPYGRITYEGKSYGAYRLVWALANGGLHVLKSGHDICHKCKNKKCCNPEHLYQGTHKQNMQDKFK